MRSDAAAVRQRSPGIGNNASHLSPTPAGGSRNPLLAGTGWRRFEDDDVRALPHRRHRTTCKGQRGVLANRCRGPARHRHRAQHQKALRHQHEAGHDSAAAVRRAGAGLATGRWKSTSGHSSDDASPPQGGAVRKAFATFELAEALGTSRTHVSATGRMSPASAGWRCGSLDSPSLRRRRPIRDPHRRARRVSCRLPRHRMQAHIIRCRTAHSTGLRSCQ